MTATGNFEAPGGVFLQVSVCSEIVYMLDGLQKVFGIVLNVSETTCDEVSVKENNGNSA